MQLMLCVYRQQEGGRKLAAWTREVASAEKSSEVSLQTELPGLELSVRDLRASELPAPASLVKMKPHALCFDHVLVFTLC